MSSTAPPSASTAERRRPGKRERVAAVLGGDFTSRLLRHCFRRPGILCLTHHRIADRVEHDPDVISATPRQLEEQARWVSGSFRSINGDEIARVIGGRAAVREPVVAWTFDDAYQDNYAAGTMLMQRFGIAATFFVPTGFIESGVIPPWDRLGYAAQHTRGAVLRVARVGADGPWEIPVADYAPAISRLMKIYTGMPAEEKDAFVQACEEAAGASASLRGSSPFMTWQQIRELRDMGHSIGAHTHTHPILASLTQDEQSREIGMSKRILEERLGQAITLFAYPYGKPERSFSALTKHVVADCGFTAAFSFYGGWNRPGRIDPMDVRRIKVDPETSMAMFRTRVITRGVVPV